MTQKEILDVLLEMRLCRNGLVQTPEQLRFSLFALTDAMSTIDFSQHGSTSTTTSTTTTTASTTTASTNQMNGVKTETTDRSSDDKTSNVISVDSSDDENEDGYKNGKNFKHTRKRSTADEESSMEKDDDVDNNVVDSNVVGDKDVDENSEVLILKENGETQAKRSKPAPDNKDW